MQKIHIKNFGPITGDVEIDISQMLVLIGEQASGKSTISKLIYFFKSLKEDLFGLIFNNLDTDEDIRISFIKEIQLKFYKFFGATKHQSNFKITYFYNKNKNIELTLNPDKYLHVKFDKDFYGEIGDEVRTLLQAIKLPTNGKNAYELIAIEQSKGKYLDRLRDIVDGLFQDSRTSLFVPAGRNITVTYSEQFKLNFFNDLTLDSKKEKGIEDSNQSVDIHLMLEFLKKMETIKEVFRDNDFDTLIDRELHFKNIDEAYTKVLLSAKQIIFDILKGKYVHNEQGERIVFNTQKNQYVHLNNASSGQQESVRILQDIFLILLNKQDVFRIIEEPEAHLYPLAQKKLIELLAMVLNYTDSQIIITTHSPYILSVVNNLIFAKSIHTLKVESSVAVNGFELPENTMIDPTKFRAYGIKNKEEWEFVSIFDKSTNLINQNYLDEISEIVGSEFDEMFELYKQLKPRKRVRKTN